MIAIPIYVALAMVPHIIVLFNIENDEFWVVSLMTTCLIKFCLHEFESFITIFPWVNQIDSTTTLHKLCYAIKTIGLLTFKRT